MSSRITPRAIRTGLAGTAVLLLLALGWAVSHILTRSLPRTDGTLRTEGLLAPVEIHRDAAGVPHILAANDADAAFACGFVHAQDRLWQMDVLRRYGQGRLAEIFGSAALPSDRTMRTIGLARVADSLYLGLPAVSRATLDAYTRGVNAGMREAAGRLPLEFDLLLYDPEPWTPQHSIIVSRLMGWELALSWWVDLTLADLVATLGEEKAREIFPLDEGPASFIAAQRTSPPSPARIPVRMMERAPAPSPAGASRGVLRDARQALRDAGAALAAARSVLGGTGSAVGSNAWAVTGARSATGSPILAGDPHLMHLQPARWYALHINAPGLNVAGVSLPGTPGVVIGHNDSVAWSFTNLMADDVDFTIERINERDSTWEYRGTRRRLAVRIDSIFVRDSLPVPLTVLESAHGPLVDLVHERRHDPQRRIRDLAVAMRWTGFERSDEVLAIHRLNRARNTGDIVAALQTFGVPAQRVVHAARDGSIGVTTAGMLPLRPPAAAQLPSTGWDGAGEWRGFVRTPQLPRELDPPSQAVAAANNRITAAALPYISALWESDARVDRIRGLLEEQRVFSAHDMRLMQMDMQAADAAPLRDAMTRALARMPGRSLDVTRAVNMLAQWDLRMTPTSPAAAIFAASYQHLVRETFQDEMGADLFRRYVRLSNLPYRVLPRLLRDSSTTWFDDTRTVRIETRDDVLRKSVMLALLDLGTRLGPRMDEWNWGAVHRVTFRHPLGEVGPLGRILDVGPLAVGGSNATINNGEFSHDTPYDAVVGASMRIIVDLAATDTCDIVLTTGQSGQPMSPHYADQATLWQNGAYHRLISNVAVVRGSGWPCLRLHP